MYMYVRIISESGIFQCILSYSKIGKSKHDERVFYP